MYVPNEPTVTDFIQPIKLRWTASWLKQEDTLGIRPTVQQKWKKQMSFIKVLILTDYDV